jgi:hypothetical protein
MFLTILKLAWPYIMRTAMSQGAEYIEKLRHRHELTSPEPQLSADCPPCPPCPPCPTDEAIVEAIVEASAASGSSSGGTIWYALSGVLLGSAFSLMLYLILQNQESRV